MKQQDVAIEVVAASRRNPKEHRFLSQKSGAGVFHSTVSKAGNHHHVVLGKRERLGKETEKIIDSLGRNLLLFRLFLFRLLEFRLADIQSRQARRFTHLAKWASSEGEKIGDDRFFFFKKRGAPANLPFSPTRRSSV